MSEPIDHISSIDERKKSNGLSEIRHIITNRRSIRRFDSMRPDNELILDILDVGQWAPTHCNTQDVYFLVIDDNKIKQQIVDMGGSIIIKSAPVGVLVLYKNSSDNLEYLDYIQSGAAVIQNILLYAHAIGLGTCWIAHLPRKDDLRKLLNIPTSYDPIAYILMGYPLKEPPNVPRKHLISEIVSYNSIEMEHFQPDTSNQKKFRRSFRKLYYKSPTFIKKIINPIVDKLFVKKFGD
jgi:nitroreductase